MLKRLIISDASFLSTHEKLILEEYCVKNPDIKLSEISLTEISVIVNRNLSRSVWNGFETFEKAKKSLGIIEALGIGTVHYFDADFPPLLREMKDPPYLLFYRGNLEILKKRCISVVGTRHATFSAVKSASQFSFQAAEDSCCIISGLAYGLDSAAHEGAMKSEKQGTTCAVLPSGIDTIVPASNKSLAKKILQTGGLLLSEYLPGTPAVAFRYVQRNRIVAALSAATIVIQAPSGSGAMITADLALGYDREVMFHKSAFSQESVKLDEISRQRLKNLVAQGRKVEYKLNNCPKKYIEDGANIIEDYADFKKVFAQESVEKNNKSNDLFLFSGECNG